jgi:prephenate dehydratase
LGGFQLEDLMRTHGNQSRGDPVAKVVAEVVGQWNEVSAVPEEREAFGQAMINMVKDLELSPAEFRALAAKGANARQLVHMLDALRIEAHELAQKEPALLGSLRRICSVCDRKAQCDRNIADKTLAVNYYAYCSNAAALKTLQREGRFTSAA